MTNNTSTQNFRLHSPITVQNFKSPNTSTVHERLYKEFKSVDAKRGAIYDPFRREKSELLFCTFTPRLLAE